MNLEIQVKVKYWWQGLILIHLYSKLKDNNTFIVSGTEQKEPGCQTMNHEYAKHFTLYLPKYPNSAGKLNLMTSLKKRKKKIYLYLNKLTLKGLAI